MAFNRGVVFIVALRGIHLAFPKVAHNFVSPHTDTPLASPRPCFLFNSPMRVLDFCFPWPIFVLILFLVSSSSLVLVCFFRRLCIFWLLLAGVVIGAVAVAFVVAGVVFCRVFVVVDGAVAVVPVAGVGASPAVAFGRVGVNANAIH